MCTKKHGIFFEKISPKTPHFLHETKEYCFNYRSLSCGLSINVDVLQRSKNERRDFHCADEAQAAEKGCNARLQEAKKDSQSLAETTVYFVETGKRRGGDVENHEATGSQGWVGLARLFGCLFTYLPQPSGTVETAKELAALIAKRNELQFYPEDELHRLASKNCHQLLLDYDFDKELLEKHVFWLVLRWVTDVDVLFELFLDANAKNVQLENIDDFDIRDIITKQSPKLLRLALTMELSKDFLEEEANCIAIAAAETGNPQLFEVAWKTLCEIYPENESMQPPRYLGASTKLENDCMETAMECEQRGLLQHMVNKMGFVDEGWFETLNEGTDNLSLFYQSCFP